MLVESRNHAGFRLRGNALVQGATVLIVDDDPSIRELLAETLGGEGYQTIAAAGGGEAIRCLESSDQAPDMMLLDLLMPAMDGEEVLDYLRHNLLQQFPVLMFSAQRPDASLLKALDSELRDFIAKPFELAELLVRMERLLQRSPTPSQRSGGVLRVYTLGSLRLYRDDTFLFDESWRNKPAKTIFKLLFSHRGQRYPKDVLAEELWPETDPDVAANRLRVAVHELRKMLGDRARQVKTQGYIGQQEGAYFFDTSEPYWCDEEAFFESVERGRRLVSYGQGEEALEAFHSGETLYQGDYLRDDPFLEWTIPTRERVREAHLAMLSEIASLYATRGEPGEAANFCRKILRIEPWREEVYRRLMEYLVSAGRPNEALRAFDECRRSLQVEIDTGPSPETVELRDAISRQQAAAIR